MSEPTAAPYIVTYPINTVTYPINTSPFCIICKTPKSLGVTLPYGSRFGGQFICSDCVRLFFDPIIMLATGNIKERNENT